MSDGKRAISARSFGMHTAFRDDLTVEVSEFFQKPCILKQHRATWSCGHNILVVSNRCANVVGKLFCHFSTSLL